jgi:primase-polymerase (primpol)-like protein
MEDETTQNVCVVSPTPAFEARQIMQSAEERCEKKVGAAEDESDKKGDGIILTRKGKRKDRVR